MTDREWLESNDPEQMRIALAIIGGASERRLRLVGCACCRRLWRLMCDKRSQSAVDGSELFADKRLTAAALKHLSSEASKAFEQAHNDFFKKSVTPAAIAGAASYLSKKYFDINMLSNAMGAAAEAAQQDEAVELASQAHLIRDIFGNPFRPVLIEPSGLIPQIVSLATVAYEERNLPTGELDTERLNVLADALEDAGCTNADILGHLRSVGVHVRGCWALDLLLGKE
jgi:hypothetical protein